MDEFASCTILYVKTGGCVHPNGAGECEAFCGIGECYIPGKQTKCDLAPACNNHGSCIGAPSGPGQCIFEQGYDPKSYCKNKKAIWIFEYMK